MVLMGKCLVNEGFSIARVEYQRVKAGNHDLQQGDIETSSILLRIPTKTSGLKPKKTSGIIQIQHDQPIVFDPKPQKRSAPINPPKSHQPKGRSAPRCLSCWLLPPRGQRMSMMYPFNQASMLPLYFPCSI